MNKEFFYKTLRNNRKLELSTKLATELSAEDEVTEDIQEQINKAVDKWIEEENDGKDYIEIYADYDDELPEEDIQQILEAKDPRDMFYDIVSEYYLDYDTSYSIDRIFDALDLSDEIKSDDDSRIEILDVLRDKIYWEPPYDHYLNQEVFVDVFLKEAEDLVNDSLAYFNDEGNLEKVGRPVIWLLERQGYSEDEFIKYYNSLEDFEQGSGKTNYDTNTFFGSLVQEIDNFTGTYPELVFLGNINLKDYVNGYSYVHIPEDCMCGFVDTYNGAGSVLEVKLEKPINLPKDEVIIKDYDGYRYNVNEIYGLVSKAWDTKIKLEGGNNE